MKTLKDFYFENPQAYANIVAQANREHKDIQIIDDKLVLVEREPVVLDYKHQRSILYPPIKEQLDMIWHDKQNGTNVWFDKIKEIKEKYPKQ